MTEVSCVNSVLRGAKVLHQLGRFNEAEQLYSKALCQLGPENEDFHYSYMKQLSACVYNDRGHCRYMQVYFDEAVEDYTRAIQLDPTLAAAYYNRGTVHYRLCAAKPPGDRQAILQAIKDFEEAVRFAPNNQEFQEGLKNCKDMDPGKQGDGNIMPKKKKNSFIYWPSIPYGKLVKLLFLLDNGDKTTGSTDADRESNIAAAAEAKEAFHSVLRGGDRCSFQQVLSVLRKRIQELADYPFIMVLGETEAANRAVRKKDEDLLTLGQACEYLGIELHNLDNKIRKVQEKLFLDDREMQGSFFIYAENLRMNRICDGLTPTLVYRLLEIARRDDVLNKLIDADVDASEQKANKVEGFKEALFFYLIRLLEEHDKLNRVYTDKLEDLLERLGREAKGEEGRRILRLAATLGDYPSECRPAGHCVVFCVTKEREGAKGEIDKVKRVFEDSLGYTVQVIENPTQEKLEDYRKGLKKQKYRFYDSIVYWFMTHGKETSLWLADDKLYERKVIIDSFSKLDNFRKKPKIFFMASCRGDSTISVSQKGGVRVTVDGSMEGMTFSEIPERCYNITAVYYQMDRLVANATLPEHYSFRLPDGGSVYVDTVCRLLEKHRGENITQVLERACNRMHQILFSCQEKFEGEAKQACNYETTFQKTFLVPSASTKGLKGEELLKKDSVNGS